MAVTVRLFAAARSAAGTNETTVEPGSLAEVLLELHRRYPELTAIVGRCSFLIDGTAVHGEHSEVTVAPGSTIDVLPPFTGG